MKSQGCFKFIVMLLAVLCGLAGNAFAQDSLLLNSDFEDWEEQIPQPQHWRRNSGVMERSGESETGKIAMRLRTRAAHNNEGSAFQIIDIEGEHTLNLNARLKTEGNVLVYAQYRAQDAAGNRIAATRDTGGTVRNLTDWGNLQWQFKTPQGTHRLYVFIRVRSEDESQGSVLIDRINLVREGVCLENAFLEIFINERNIGGRIQSLRLKNEKAAEHVYWENPLLAGGFSAEIFPPDKSPGILRNAVYEVIEVDKSGRRAVLAHDLREPEYAGLRVEKEYSLPEDGAYVDVRVSMLNRGSRELPVSFRVKNVLPTGKGILTYPAKGHVGVYDMSTDPARRGTWELADIENGWVAHTTPDGESGVVFMFDREEVDKAFCWLGGAAGRFNTLEWSYAGKTLLPGANRSVSYRIVPVASGAPVFSADHEMIVGLAPLRFPVDGGALMDVTAYGSTRKWSLKLEARAQQTGDCSFSSEFESSPTKPRRLQLPWAGAHLMDVSLTGESKGVRHRAFLAEQERVIKVDAGLELPDVKVATEKLADEVVSYFPYGGYLNDSSFSRTEGGSTEQSWRRILRLFRRNHMNTVTSVIQMNDRILRRARENGIEPFSEKLRKHDMRVIPRQETFSARYFKNSKNLTRDIVLAAWKNHTSADIIELLRWHAETYNDIILGYDISDEPGEALIPAYLYMKDVFKGINSERPAIPILMYHQLSYIPYVPVYYLDRFPIRSEARGGRNPWHMGKDVRKVVVEEARGAKPVWAMAQAFAWDRWILPNEAETRYMAYAVLANGGKALIYHGIVHHPRWLVNRGYPQRILCVLGTWTKEWHVLGEVGKHLTAAGMATMDHLPADNTGITVDCGQINAGRYEGPAIVANVLAGENGGMLVVVQNQDMESGHSGILRIPTGKAEGRVLYDLKKLEVLSSAGVAPVSTAISLALPGDAALLYLGTEEQVASIHRKVCETRYRNERAIFNIDLELAENNHADVIVAKRLSKEAEIAFAAGKYESSLAIMMSARKEIEDIIKRTVPLGKAKEAAESARQALSEVTELYGTHLETITPKELMESTKRSQRFAVNTGYRPAEIDMMVEITADLIRRLNDAEDQLYLGDARKVADELLNVAEETARHLTQARKYLDK